MFFLCVLLIYVSVCLLAHQILALFPIFMISGYINIKNMVFLFSSDKKQKTTEISRDYSVLRQKVKKRVVTANYRANLALLILLWSREPEPEEKDKLMDQIQKRMLSLTENDTLTLNQQERGTLRHWLKSPDSQTVLGTLYVVTLLGDKQSLKTVEELWQGKHRANHDYDVLKAAQDCLPRLKARIAALERGEGLLRPSASPEPAKSLLRPSGTPEEADPAQLLRSSEEP